MKGQVRDCEEETAVAITMTEMQRQNDDGSEANQDKQVESIMNINECVSCTAHALHRRYTGEMPAIQAEWK